MQQALTSFCPRHVDLGKLKTEVRFDVSAACCLLHGKVLPLTGRLPTNHSSSACTTTGHAAVDLFIFTGFCASIMCPAGGHDRG